MRATLDSSPLAELDMAAVGEYAAGFRREKATDFAGDAARLRALRDGIIARVSARRDRATRRAVLGRYEGSPSMRSMRAPRRASWKVPTAEGTPRRSARGVDLRGAPIVSHFEVRVSDNVERSDGR